MKMIITILLILLILFIFLFLWTWIGYPIFLLFASKLFRKKHLISEGYMPKVTLMIMSYNEAKVIEKKIKNSLELDYPKDKLEIFVVDSASNDSTQDIVRKYSKDVKLIEQSERKGKASAINYRKYLTNEEISNLIDNLFACSEPSYTPDGRIIVNIISEEEITKKFK